MGLKKTIEHHSPTSAHTLLLDRNDHPRSFVYYFVEAFAALGKLRTSDLFPALEYVFVGYLVISMIEMPVKSLASVADFIERKRHGTNWVLMAGLIDYNLDENPRLVKSQGFGDKDYSTWILRFLKDAYKNNPEDAKFVISRIVRDGDEQDALDPEFRHAFEALGVIPESGATAHIVPIMRTKYLDIESFPHDFYRELREQINACYQQGHYPASLILIRKMLENCLIDILRRRYGLINVRMFYDTTKGRFHDFSVLLETARNKIGDFVHVKDTFNADLLREIDNFREQGNSSAHNISLDIQAVRLELDANRSKINFAVKSLFRTISNLQMS